MAVDPWDHIRRAAADRRSGSVDIALRAADGLAALGARRDVLRAARALLHAHPAMASLWRLCSEAYERGAHGAETFAERLEAETRAASDAVRWVITRRSAVVLTHSASSSVAAALERVQGRVARVICSASLPGGEGRAFARRLERAGFEAGVIPDAALAAAADEAHVALVGADAVTADGVVNKVGTRLLALAARDAGIGCYAIAASAKLLPFAVEAPTYEETALALFDAVVTERGPQRPGALRRAVARVRIAPEIARLAR